jgi:ribosomal protein S17
VVLKKLTSFDVNAAENEPFTLIYSDYNYDYVLDTPKELIQLNIAQHEMKQVYPNSRIFHKFAKGAVATARAGRLIEKQLAMTKAAENARKMRANQGKNSVQRGGVISVRECRRMVSGRKDEEDCLKMKREMRIMRQQRKQ